MKLDRLFEKAPLLEPPDSLKRSVMGEVRADAGAAEAPPPFAGVSRYFQSRRAAWSFVAVAAAILLTVRILGWPELTPAPMPVEVPAVREIASAAQLDEFLDETLGPVFDFKQDEVFTYEDESADIDRFISTHLNEIFWIDGGSNA